MAAKYIGANNEIYMVWEKPRITREMVLAGTEALKNRGIQGVIDGDAIECYYAMENCKRNSIKIYKIKRKE